MAQTDSLMPEGEKIRKAIRWISDTLREHPEKKRQQVLLEAELRFDLTPKESEFLNTNFGKVISCPNCK